jgi:hypothetical protein
VARSKYIKIAAGIGACIAALALVVSLKNRPDRPSRGEGETAKVSQGTGVFDYIRSFFAPEELEYDSVVGDNERIRWVIEKQKERYAGKLGNKAVQVRILGGLIRYMKKSHPDDWKERIKIIIEKDFPDQAPGMIDKLNKLEAYQRFLDEKKADLDRMSHDRRKDAIQEKRKEIFGSEYYEIWKGAIAREEVSSMLNRLNYNKDLSLNEKLAEYKSFTREFYPNQPDASLAETDDDVMVRNYKLVKQFIAMPSVQAGLKSMTADERADFLRNVRQTMGLSGETIEKMAELDKTTDELWKRKE